MKKLLLLLCVFFVAASYAVAETYEYSWTISGTDKSSTSASFDIKFGDLTWKCTHESYGSGRHSQRNGTVGIVFGSKANPVKDVVFSISGPFVGKNIKSIQVKAFQGNKTQCTFVAKLGGVSVGDAQSLVTGTTLGENKFGEINKILSEGETLDLCFHNDNSTLNMTGNTGFTIGGITIIYEDPVSTGPVDYEPNFEALALKVGDSRNVQPEKAPVMAFSSDNQSVVSVEGGVLSAKAEGTAKISVTWAADENWNEGSTSFDVTVLKNVYEPAWNDIDLEENDEYTLALGDNHPETILFESDNESVAMIDETGFIIAIAEGTANITAMWGDDAWADGEKTFTVTVTKPLVDVVLTWSAQTASANLGEEFEAPVLSADPEAALAEVVYSSSDAAVADFVEGVLVINAAGKATITATISGSKTYNDAEASYELTVVDPNAPVVLEATIDFKNVKHDDLYDGSGFIANDVQHVLDNGVIVYYLTENKTQSFRQYGTGSYDFRLYTGAAIQFTAPDGYELANISFTKTGNSYFGVDASVGSISNDTWSAPTNECVKTVKFVTTKQNRYYDITVTMVECEVAAPVITITPGMVSVKPTHKSHSIAWRILPYGDQPENVMRAVAATDWTTHTAGETLVHEAVNSDEDYVLELKAVSPLGKESDVYAMLVSADGNITGITDVVVDAAGEVEMFNLQGVRVEGELTPGVYIRRQGCKTSKVIVK